MCDGLVYVYRRLCGSSATNLQAQPAHIYMTCNLLMSPAPLWLVPPSTFLVTYHNHLRPNLQPPIMIISAVRSIWIRGMAISCMASHIGSVIGGRVERSRDLYVLGSIVLFAFP
eukprot:4160961-Pleurochrysis_carterae.AAC.1